MSDSQVSSIATDTTELGRIHSARLSDAQSQMIFALMRLQDPRVDFILREFNCTVIVGPRVALEYGEYAPQVKQRELVECKARIALEQELQEKAIKKLKKRDVKPDKDGNFTIVAHPKSVAGRAAKRRKK